MTEQTTQTVAEEHPPTPPDVAAADAAADAEIAKIIDSAKAAAKAEADAEKTAAQPTPEQTQETPEQQAARESAEKEKSAKEAAEKALADERTARQGRLRDAARALAERNRARAELATERAKRQQLETQRQQEIERVRRAEEIEARSKDPKQWLENLRQSGVTAKELVDAAMREDSPEHLFQKAKQEALAELRAEQAKKDAEREQQFQQQAHVNALRSFVGMVQTAKKEEQTRYPALTSMYSDVEIAMQADRVVQQARAAGLEYTDEEIADFLEEQAEPRYTKIRGAAKAAPPQASTANHPAAATSSPAARAPTLANSATSTNGIPKTSEHKFASEKEENDYWSAQYDKELAKRVRR